MTATVATIAVGVMARAPIPGRCKTHLLAAHEAGWVAGLYAAMLRDTLDGLQMVTADAYVVVAAPDPEADELLRRHVPTPWELAYQEGATAAERVRHALGLLLERADVAVLASSDAPSFPTEPLEQALAAARDGQLVVGPSEGGAYVVATRRQDDRLFTDLAWGTPGLLEVMRVRCRDQGLELHELPMWYQVREPSDVLTLFEELRKHPDRAPRTAQFLVTRG